MAVHLANGAIVRPQATQRRVDSLRPGESIHPHFLPGYYVTPATVMPLIEAALAAGQADVTQTPTLSATFLSGLSNRLMGLITTKALAAASGRRFFVLWPQTPECGVAFQRLFVNDWPILEVTPAQIADIKEWRRFGKFVPNLLDAREPHLAVRVAYWVLYPHLYPDHEPLVAESLAALNSLELQPALQAGVQAFQDAHFRSPMIGVHLRRGDYVGYFPTLANNTATAMQAVDHWLARWPDAGILLCSDDGANSPRGRKIRAEGVHAKFRRRYGDRVVWTTPRSLDRAQPEAIEDAVIDLWLLRQTQAMVRSSFSTFSDLAVLGRDIPHVTCETPQWQRYWQELPLRASGLYWLERWFVRDELAPDAPVAVTQRLFRSRVRRSLRRILARLRQPV
jgi:hypothetical protein